MSLSTVYDAIASRVTFNIPVTGLTRADFSAKETYNAEAISNSEILKKRQTREGNEKCQTSVEKQKSQERQRASQKAIRIRHTRAE